MSDSSIALILPIPTFIFYCFWVWLNCKLVKRGIIKDSFLLIIIGIGLGGIWIPLVYYFWAKDKYQKLAKQKAESLKTANQATI